MTKTMKVWVGGEEIERPIASVEKKIRHRFGGCDEIVEVLIPELHPGEKMEWRRNRIMISADQS